MRRELQARKRREEESACCRRKLSERKEPLVVAALSLPDPCSTMKPQVSLLEDERQVQQG